MSKIIRNVRESIAGRAIVTGPPLRRMSECLLCGLDSGPWMTRGYAEVSGLLHVTSHHPDEDPRLTTAADLRDGRP